MTKNARFSWRKRRSKSFSAPLMYELWRGNDHFATMQEMTDGKWYVYSGPKSPMRFNTLNSPLAFSKAQAHAVELIKTGLFETYGV